jgi:hypothetical protein
LLSVDEDSSAGAAFSTTGFTATSAVTASTLFPPLPRPPLRRLRPLACSAVSLLLAVATGGLVAGTSALGLETVAVLTVFFAAVPDGGATNAGANAAFLTGGFSAFSIFVAGFFVTDFFTAALAAFLAGLDALESAPPALERVLTKTPHTLSGGYKTLGAWLLIPHYEA